MMQDLVVCLVFIGYAVAVLLLFGTVLTWVERKQAAIMSDRIGANRAESRSLEASGRLREKRPAHPRSLGRDPEGRSECRDYDADHHRIAFLGQERESQARDDG